MRSNQVIENVFISFRAVRSGRDGKRGYSLVEVMVASVLLALMVAGSLQVLTEVTRTSTMVRARNVATTLAWSRIERARHVNFEDIDLLAEASPGTVINEAGLADQNGDFRRVTVINTTTNGLPEKHIRVDVFPRSAHTDGFSAQPETVESLIVDVEKGE